jgi:hypothetical protein
VEQKVQDDECCKSESCIIMDILPCVPDYPNEERLTAESPPSGRMNPDLSFLFTVACCSDVMHPEQVGFATFSFFRGIL